ncbi:MAG: hypothetical protein K2Y51_19835 [Gammaproteobacteria bacterium]|nr:hypothetical protein [Gammaproteobacteria bacterium]
MHLLPQGRRDQVLDPWCAALRAKGDDPARYRVGLIRPVLVSEDRKRDWAVFKPSEIHRMAKNSDWAASSPDQVADFRDPQRIPQQWIIGDVEHCVATLCDFIREFCMTDMVTWGAPPGLHPECMNASLERLAKEVLPRVREAEARGERVGGDGRFRRRSGRVPRRTWRQVESLRCRARSRRFDNFSHGPRPGPFPGTLRAQSARPAACLAQRPAPYTPLPSAPSAGQGPSIRTQRSGSVPIIMAARAACAESSHCDSDANTLSARSAPGLVPIACMPAASFSALQLSIIWSSSADKSLVVAGTRDIV